MKNKIRKKIKASIIIRTYNEEKLVGRCLDAVFNQKTDFPFEVIIVDSGSSDKTLEIAKMFPVDIIKIRKEEFSYGRALNLGCESARGEFLVFLSAHAIPSNERWLSSLIKDLDDSNIAGVYGKQSPAEDCNPLMRRRMLNFWGDKKRIQKQYSFFSNANSAIRKELWEKIKFDERLPTAEDHKWAKSVQERGFFIIYEPKAEVTHSHNESIKEIFARYRRETTANYLIYGNKVLFILFKDSLHNFYDDVRYVLNKNYNLYWAVRAGVNNLCMLGAIALIIARRAL